MKILKVEAENFGSYKQFAFTFANQGLTLIHGPTGSGKSTVMDVVCWGLLGITAKNGNADDVRTWNVAEESTYVILTLLDNAGLELTITRLRGRSNKNDLYYTEDGQPDLIRGKDLPETQTLLEARLGINRDLYLTATYFNEFSDTTNFFNTTAKNRRELFERIANLSLPTTLYEKVIVNRKKTKELLAQTQLKRSTLQGSLSYLNKNIVKVQTLNDNWMIDESKRKALILKKYNEFELEVQNKILKLELEQSVLQQEITGNHAHTTKCETCGHVTVNDTIKLKISRNDYLVQMIEKLKTQTNPHDIEESYSTKVNPFIMQLEESKAELISIQNELLIQTTSFEDHTKAHSRLNILYDLSFDLRGALLNASIAEAERLTNELLQKYFDGEFRVAFSITKSDSLDIQIQKNSMDCVYKQLSKGQRQLLKLCFSISMMKLAANESGCHFDNLFFDEATDGCDTDLKLKSFRLFQDLALSHDSVFLIDHSEELKSMFDNRYKVSIGSDASIIEQD